MTITNATKPTTVVDSSATVIPISVATEPTTASGAAFTDFILAQIRIAKTRAELTVTQADMAITALSAGLITPEPAILVLAECGLPLDEVSS
jgi:hypothetical protein